MSVDLSTADASGRTQQKCEAILTAAAQAFLTVGFERANMDEIAAAADVSKRTIYHHYESKEGLFEAVVAALVGRITREGEVPWDSARSIDAQVLDIAHRKLALFEDRHFTGLARMVFGTFAAHPDLAARAMRALQQCDYGIVGWIEAAHRDRALTGVDAHAADQLFGTMVMSTLVWPMLSGQAVEAATLRSQIEAIARMFAAHLAGS